MTFKKLERFTPRALHERRVIIDVRIYSNRWWYVQIGRFVVRSS